MNQAEAVRYKNRIRVGSIATFVAASSIGAYLFAKNSAGSVDPGLITTIGLPETLLSAAIVVLPFALTVSYVLYSILNFIFMRNPGYMLEEGCYSDTSWLNLKDNQLVLLDQDSILTADFDGDQATKISETYANDSSCQDLLYVLSSQQLRRLSIANIDSLMSDKDDHCIEIISRDETLTLRFSNTGTKAHALHYITARLPATVSKKETRTAGLKSALPQLTVCGLFALGGLLSNQASLAIVIALPAVLLLPGVLESAFGPALITEWLVEDTQATQTHVPEPSTHRQAA